MEVDITKEVVEGLTILFRESFCRDSISHVDEEGHKKLSIAGNWLAQVKKKFEKSSSAG